MNYADLVEEAARRVGADDFASRADDAINRAWFYMNRKLRIEPMRKTVAVTTDEDGNFSLPDNFLEARLLYFDGRDDPSQPLTLTREALREELTFIPDSDAFDRYRLFHSYTIVKGAAVTGHPDTNMVFLYYENIPTPTRDAPDQTFLTEHQDLCSAAVVYQGATIFNNVELALGMKAYVDAELEEVQAVDDRTRYVGMTVEKRLGPQFVLRDLR